MSSAAAILSSSASITSLQTTSAATTAGIEDFRSCNGTGKPRTAVTGLSRVWRCVRTYRACTAATTGTDPPMLTVKRNRLAASMPLSIDARTAKIFTAGLSGLLVSDDTAATAAGTVPS